jgi:ABC-type branched-subunit amino acid transport system ATPase component
LLISNVIIEEVIMSDNLLRLINVSKEYSGNKVLKDINIELKRGQIHALIGENGAGKSTLMNILFGMSVIHTTGGFEGTIEIEGKVADIKSPHDAMDYGIGMVHQEFMLIPGFTIMENIKLNREITKPNLVSSIFGKRLETLDIKRMNEDTRKALDVLDMNIEEYVQVAGLPVGHMQFIEIAREIDKTGLKILVFDEPTAVLAEAEAANLLKAIKKLAGYKAVIDWTKLGYTTYAIISLRVRTDDYDRLLKQLKNLIIPDLVIEECHIVTGTWCILMKVRCMAPAGLKAIQDELHKIDCIRESSTSLILSSIYD